MWPTRPEMTRDECRKCLRFLELDAYGSMVSVLRAQGPFTSEKQKLLQELAKVLHISNERHRAEVRRAVNDEKLATIAEQLNGPNTGIDWTIEGRRTIPLLPRLKPRSAFTTLANSLSLVTAAANEKKPDRHVILGRPENRIPAAETDPQREMKVEKDLHVEEDLHVEDLHVDTKLCSLENEHDNDRTLQENSNPIKAEDEKIVNKDAVEEVIEKPKVLKVPEKRRSPSPLPTAPPNKILAVSPDSFNHHVFTRCNIDKSIENNGQVSQATTVRRTLIPFTFNEILGNANKTVDLVQNKVSTKVMTAAVSSSTLNVPLNSSQSENRDVQLPDDTNAEDSSIADDAQRTQKSENTSSNLSCIKRVAPIIHTNTKPVVSKPVISSNTHRVMAVHPGTTVSSGPGPPQVKQASPIIAYKKWPYEQTATFNPQSTAKMSVTLNSKKAVNIPHHSNTKLTAKTNVIVIQKAHSKGVTLSHAGKEVLGKVIMGGKNLCVTQHDLNSVNVPARHFSLNREQTTTTLPIAMPNAESIKKAIKPGNAIVFNLRQDVLEKNKILSQRFDSDVRLNSEPKTVIQNKYTRFLTGEYNSDTNTIDRESSLEKDSVITSAVEEKQHRKNKDLNACMNSQVINSLDSSKVVEIKEIIKPRHLASMQDDLEGNIRIEDSSEDTDASGTTLESIDVNLENLQYPETVTINHVDEDDDS